MGTQYTVTIVVESSLKLDPFSLKENLKNTGFSVKSVVSKQTTSLLCTEIEDRNMECVYVTVNVFNVSDISNPIVENYTNSTVSQAVSKIIPQEDRKKYKVVINPVYSSSCPHHICSKKKINVNFGYAINVFGAAAGTVLPHVMRYVLSPSNS